MEYELNLIIKTDISVMNLENTNKLAIVLLNYGVI